MIRVTSKSVHFYLELKSFLRRSAKCLKFLLEFQNLGKLTHSRGFFGRQLIINGEQGLKN